MTHGLSKDSAEALLTYKYKLVISNKRSFSDSCFSNLYALDESDLKIQVLLYPEENWLFFNVQGIQEVPGYLSGISYFFKLLPKGAVSLIARTSWTE